MISVSLNNKVKYFSVIILDYHCGFLCKYFSVCFPCLFSVTKNFSVIFSVMISWCMETLLIGWVQVNSSVETLVKTSSTLDIVLSAIVPAFLAFILLYIELLLIGWVQGSGSVETLVETSFKVAIRWVLWMQGKRIEVSVVQPILLQLQLN